MKPLVFSSNCYRDAVFLTNLYTFLAHSHFGIYNNNNLSHIVYSNTLDSPNTIFTVYGKQVMKIALVVHAFHKKIVSFILRKQINIK